MNTEIDNRDKIIEAAGEQFQRYGFKKTTMNDIADQLQMAKSTLYYYFKNKEDLFEACMLVEMNSIEKAIQKAVSKAETLEEKLTTYSVATLKEVKNTIKVYCILKDEIKNFAPITFKKKHNFFQRSVDRLYEIINSCKPEEIEILKSKVDLDVFIKIMVSVVDGLVKNLVIFDEMDVDEEGFTDVIKIFFSGLNK